MSRSAIVLGATGLVGSFVVNQLLKDENYSVVKIISRRALKKEHPKLMQEVVSFDKLNDNADLLTGDDIFCCLGTTIKKAHSKENFRKVDLQYPLKAATIASLNGVEKFLMVSAIGADPASRIFYNRTKGEAEEAIKKISIPVIGIFRPSILEGQRRESRSGETAGLIMMKIFSPFFVGKLRKYRPIHAKAVAAAMIEFAKSSESGIHTFESDEIKKLAAKKS